MTSTVRRLHYTDGSTEDVMDGDSDFYDYSDALPLPGDEIHFADGTVRIIAHVEPLP